MGTATLLCTASSCGPGQMPWPWSSIGGPAGLRPGLGSSPAAGGGSRATPAAGDGGRGASPAAGGRGGSRASPAAAGGGGWFIL